MTIAILGAGMVGHAIALDLSEHFSILSIDRDEQALRNLSRASANIQTRLADLMQYSDYPALLAGADLVVTAVPGFMGYKTLEAVIKAGKPVVDISFFPEDVLTLNKLAREKKVTVITDCGVAPGMSNLILGRCNETMNIRSFACYVGGLPKKPQPPFYYKAPFSPVDVVEEYTRPARLMEHGQIVTRPALTQREKMYFDGVGELEAFNTDGLRSLLYTMSHIPDMKEKTLRYPGHLDLILSLEQAGFFNRVPKNINGISIAPLDMTAQLLKEQWTYEPGEEEFTVMKVIIRGEEKTVEYNLLDEYDPETGISSMARTTGYTCAAAVNLLAEKLFTQHGVFPPELVGKDERCFDFIMDYLEARKVNWEKTVKENHRAKKSSH